MITNGRTQPGKSKSTLTPSPMPPLAHTQQHPSLVIEENYFHLGLIMQIDYLHGMRVLLKSPFPKVNIAENTDYTLTN